MVQLNDSLRRFTRIKTVCFKNFRKFVLNLWLDKGKGSCNGNCREWWYHSFDYLKYKHYRGSLLKKETFSVKFTQKAYSKGCMTSLAQHERDRLVWYLTFAKG